MKPWKQTFRLLVGLLCLLLTSGQVSAQIYKPCELPDGAFQGSVPDKKEAQALRELFAAAGGMQWMHKTGWLSDGCHHTEFAQWYGVTVQDGDVVALDLSANGLAGTLPASLVRLQRLESLQLQYNSLTGSIPDSVAYLGILSNLDLSNNQLNGSLPAMLGISYKLAAVNLGHNNLNGPLPSSMFWGGLLTLDLSENHFSGLLPNSLGDCLHLNQLLLAHNSLSGELSYPLSKLVSAQQIDLSYNAFTGNVSVGVGNSPFLTSLNLSHNLIQRIPVFHEGSTPIHVNVEANALDFGTLEPNFSAAGIAYTTPFDYLGQVLSTEEIQETQPITDPIVLGLTMGGAHNSYRWQKLVNGVFVNINGATTADFRIERPQASDAGSYRCAVLNSFAIILELYSPVTTITLTPAAHPLPPNILADDNNRNWVIETVYDGSAEDAAESRITGESKQFSDGLGRTTQAQARNLTEQHVLATQTIYSSGGQAVISTLAAPIENQSFNYAETFVQAAGASGTSTYGPADFEDANANNPAVVADAVPGTLGYYYSTHNVREPNTPATQYPFSIQQYYDGPLGGVKRATGPGDVTRMGTGREMRSGRVPILQEMDHYATWRSQFGLDPAPGNTYLRQGMKEISIGPDGKESIVFTDRDGNTLAACLSGAQYPGFDLEGAIHSEPTNSQGLPQFLDIHIPAAGPTVVTIQGSGQVKIIDLLTDALVAQFNTSPAAPGQPIPVSTQSLVPGFYRVLSLSDNQAVRYHAAYGDFSYSYYDDAGRPIASIATKGISFAPGALPSFVERNQYNAPGFLINTTSPDEGRTDFVYRRNGMLRFSQSELQRTKRQFSYCNVDSTDRVIESGVYTMPVTPGAGDLKFETHLTALPDSRSVLRSIILEDRTRTGGLGTNTSRRSEINSIWYDFAFPNDLDALGLTDRRQRFVLGAVSKSTVSPTVANGPTYTTWYSYDDLGRLDWMVQRSPMGVKTVDYTYDVSGNVQEVAYQKHQPDAFYHYYQYDADERLRTVYTSPDGITRTQLARYSYYLHGPLKRAELANQLQGLDYVYTITGQLKSINHRDPGRDPEHDAIDNNGIVADLFGLTLEYFSGDYHSTSQPVATTPLPPTTANPDRFDGTIRAAGWHTTAHSPVATSTDDVPAQHLTAYQYDNKGQFTDSEDGTFNALVQQFAPTANFGNSERELAYDPNGNITRLLRRDGAGMNKANFDYQYKPGTNQLTQVLNRANNQPAIQYTYDEVGQMTAQQDDEAGDRYLTYDASGLVTGVYRDAARTLPIAKYTYDDRGFRASKQAWGPQELVSDPGPGGGGGDKSRTVTWEYKGETFYVRDASGNVLSIYEQSPQAAALLRTEAPLYGASRVGTYLQLPNGTTDTRYELSDHLGNARVVFHRALEKKYVASLEIEEAEQEENDFENIAETRYQTLDAYDGKYVSRLPEVEIEAFGPRKTLTVAAGDSIRFGAWVMAPSVQPVAIIPAGPTIGLLAGSALAASTLAPGTGVAGNTGTEPAPRRSWLGQTLSHLGIGVAFRGLFTKSSAASPTAAAPLPGGTLPDAKAWLVYRLRDANGNILTEERQLATDGAVDAWQYMELQTVADQVGSIDLEIGGGKVRRAVYFDQIEVRQRGSLVVQEQYLYPYGAPITGLSYVTDGRRYRYGYQGKYAENDAETGWQSFELRLYEARTGRWTSTDPYGQFASPYTGMGNNPVSGVDPDGGWMWSWAGAAMGAATGAVVGGISSDWDGKKMLIGAGIGAVAGGILGGIGDEAGTWQTRTHTNGLKRAWNSIREGVEGGYVNKTHTYVRHGGSGSNYSAFLQKTFTLNGSGSTFSFGAGLHGIARYVTFVDIEHLEPTTAGFASPPTDPLTLIQVSDQDKVISTFGQSGDPDIAIRGRGRVRLSRAPAGKQFQVLLNHPRTLVSASGIAQATKIQVGFVVKNIPLSKLRKSGLLQTGFR